MNDNIKIALCFSGEPRERHLASRSLVQARDFCAKHNITLHIFCHFWDTITKRNYIYDKDDYIVQYINKQDLLDDFTPTSSIIETKDTLNNYCELTYNYVQDLIKPIGTPTNNLKRKKENNKLDRDIWYICKDLDRLKNQIKHTNTPPISQLFSICKSHDIRIQYEKQNNIQYDVVVRLRTDCSLTLPSFDKLNADKEKFKNKDMTTVFFPQMWSTLDKLDEDESSIGVEFAMFVGTSKTLSEQVFHNYENNILKNLFRLNPHGRLFFITSHNFFPNLIMNTTNNIDHIRSGTFKMKYKLQQMEAFR